MVVSFVKKFARSLDGPIVLAAIFTVGFYSVMGLESMKHTLVHKYTCEHASEYVIVAMLSWGIADLLLRAWRFRLEHQAFHHNWLPPRRGPEPASMASKYYDSLDQQPPAMQATRLCARFRQALTYVHQKQSADGFDDHLRDLSERDSHRTHTNYAVARFVVWVSPVLGFLGTVVHFGSALGGFAGNDLAARLPAVTAEMGTAFNTTTMALGTSTVIMLLMFLVERAEQGIVHEIDTRVERDLSNRFMVESAELTPVLSAIESSSRALLNAMGELARRQVQAWPEMLSMLHKSQQDWHRQQMQGWESMVNREQQRELLDLQRSLADNLQLLHHTGGFDEAVQGLTAAIHLLIARHQSPSLASSKAA